MISNAFLSCQNSVRSSSNQAPEVPEKPAAKKGKGKTGVNVSTSFNPLDQTCIHPESYHVAQRYSAHKHTRTLEQQPTPLAKACSGYDGVDFDTISHGVGYSGGGL